MHEGGVPGETLRSGREATATAIHARFGADATAVAEDLQAAQQAEYDKLRPRDALALVRRLNEHRDRLTEALHNPQRYKGKA